MNPTSNHPGGVNVSFMDGSVQFIKNSVNLQTWWFWAPGAGARSSPPTPIDGPDRSPDLRPPGGAGQHGECARMSRRPEAAARLAVTFALALAMAPAGCGPEKPKFDAAAAYTPESLAQELAFRVRSMKPSAKAAPARKKAPGKEQGKSAEAAKEAPDSTLDDVVEDAGRKLGLIEGISRDDALKATTAAVEADASLVPDDKRRLVERLGTLSGPR